MALVRVGGRLGAVVHEDAQHAALVVAGAADEEALRRLAPAFLQPVDIGLVAAGGEHDGPRLDRLFLALILDAGGGEGAVFDHQVHDLGLVAAVDAELFRRRVIGVQDRFAAALEEGVGAVEPDRAGQGRLKLHAAGRHPVGGVEGFFDQETGQILVRVALGDAQKVVVIFVHGIGAGDEIRRRVMGIADVAHVAGVAAPEILGRRLQHQHAGAAFARGQGGGHGGPAAADDNDVYFFR